MSALVVLTRLTNWPQINPWMIDTHPDVIEYKKYMLGQRAAEGLTRLTDWPQIIPWINDTHTEVIYYKYLLINQYYKQETRLNMLIKCTCNC